MKRGSYAQMGVSGADVALETCLKLNVRHAQSSHQCLITNLGGQSSRRRNSVRRVTSVV